MADNITCIFGYMTFHAMSNPTGIAKNYKEAMTKIIMNEVESLGLNLREHQLHFGYICKYDEDKERYYGMSIIKNNILSGIKDYSKLLGNLTDYHLSSAESFRNIVICPFDRWDDNVIADELFELEEDE